MAGCLARRKLTFTLTRFKDRRLLAGGDLVAYYLIAILLTASISTQNTVSQRIAALVVCVMCVLVWLSSRTIEFRESGVFVRGVFYDWSSIHRLPKQALGSHSGKIRLHVQWHLPFMIKVPVASREHVYDLLDGASRYESRPFFQHVAILLMHFLIAIALLLSSIGIVYAFEISARGPSYNLRYMLPSLRPSSP